MKKRFIAAVLFLSPLGLGAKTPGAAFLAVDPSVRAESLGGISAAAFGAEALGANPALVTPLHGRSEFYATFSQLWGDTSDGHVAFASGLNPKTAMALSARFMASDPSGGRDASGQPTGADTAARHTTVAAALSRKLARGLRVGAAGRFFESTLAGESSGVGWSVDTGVSYVVKDVLLSAAVNQLGPGIQYIRQSDPLPSVLRLETSWEPGAVTFLAGYHRSLAGSGSEAALGLEYRWRSLSLRAGLRTFLGGADNLALEAQSTADGLLDHLTTGFGLKLGENLRLDYAFQQSAPEWGADHSLALAWTWGEILRSPAPRPAGVKPKKPAKAGTPAQRRKLPK